MTGIVKSQNSKRASHPSTKFARASIRSLEELAAILGPAEVTFKKLKSYWADRCKQASAHVHAHGISGRAA